MANRRTIGQQSNFRFTGTMLHLTYTRHWVPREDILAKVASAARVIKVHSYVQEEADPECPHNHTHFFFELTKRFDTRNPRLFDVADIHPHWQPVTTREHACNIYEYHKKAPVNDSLHQVPEENPYLEGAAIPLEKAIKKADTLMRAAQLAGVEIKSISDLNLIRKEKRRKLGVTSDYVEFNRPLEENFRVLVIYGKSGTGKTQYALAHFKNALLVSHPDGYKDYDPEIHDGIVSDDMCFKHIPREACIHLLDWDFEREIHCRYTCAVIPKKTKKIFTTNIEDGDIFPDDPYGAIRRRITKKIRVDANLFDLLPMMVRQDASRDDELQLRMGADEDEGREIRCEMCGDDVFIKCPGCGRFVCGECSDKCCNTNDEFLAEFLALDDVE